MEPSKSPPPPAEPVQPNPKPGRPDTPGRVITEETRRPPIGRKTWALLLLLLAAGLALRAWYGNWDLHQSRFWDEQYALKNVYHFLFTGEVKPVKSYYPSPVWSVPLATVLRVSETLYETTGNTAFQVLDANQRFTETGILLCRLMQAIYGTLAVVFVFLAGRLMFSDQIGLLAAMMVAFAPWPIHSSGVIKPDALLLMTITMSFWASLAAVERPTVWRHVLAGVAIALAMSSKLTGGIIALPLVAATLVLGWHDRRRVVLLVVAGVSSAVAFIALNPYWMYYLHFLEGLKKDYALRAGFTEATRLQMPGKVIGFIVGDFVHGLVIGACGLVGFILLLASLLRTSAWEAPPDLSLVERARRAMFVVFPLIYSIIYTIQTPYFKPNNFLPLLLFTAIGGAWLLADGWRWARARWPWLQRPAVRAGVCGVLAVWLFVPGWLYVYRSLTPTTRDLAVRYLNKKLRPPPTARLVYAEAWDEPQPVWGGRQRRLHGGLSAVRASDRLTDIDSAALDAADGMLFFEHNLEGDAATFYKQRQSGQPAPWVEVFAAQPFKARGPTIVAVARRWRLLEPYRDLEPLPCSDAVGGCRSIELPAAANEWEMVSLFAQLFWDSLDSVSDETFWLEVGDRKLELSWASMQRGGPLVVSPRFRLGAAPQRVRLTRESPFADGKMAVQLARWVPAATGQ